jgi:hypothetical protein
MPVIAPKRPVAHLGPGALVVDATAMAVVDQAIIVGAEEFTDKAVERRGRAFLREFGPHRGLRRLTIGTSEQAIRLALFKPWPRPPVHAEALGSNTPTSDYAPDFYHAVQEIKTLKLPREPIARVLAVGTAAVLTIRNNGRFTERLLTGSSDPTATLQNGVSYRLLHFALTLPGPVLEPDDYVTELFFEAKPVLSVASAAALTRRWKSMAHGGQVGVDVRRDAFFPATWEFPAVLPFLNVTGVPSLFQYLTGGSLHCDQVSDRPVGCSGESFRP